MCTEFPVVRGMYAGMGCAGLVTRGKWKRWFGKIVWGVYVMLLVWVDDQVMGLICVCASFLRT